MGKSTSAGYLLRGISRGVFLLRGNSPGVNYPREDFPWRSSPRGDSDGESSPNRGILRGEFSKGNFLRILEELSERNFTRWESSSMKLIYALQSGGCEPWLIIINETS